MAHFPSSNLPVLIVGAGVSGLALAQGLRLRSIPFRVFERHSKSHGSQGHRFRVSKDGTTALESLLSPRSRELFHRTAATRAHIQPRYVDVRKFEFEEPVPVPDPESMPVDRAWIRMLLTLGIEDAIEYQKDFSSYQVDENGVHVSFSDGSLQHGSILVGSDGIKSKVRRQLQPERRLLDLERWIVWGRTDLTDDIRNQLSENVMTWFMALDKDANVQAVVEPMVWQESVSKTSEGALPDFKSYLYYAVSIMPEGDLPKSAEARKMLLDNVTETWHPALRLLFDSANHDLSACVPIFSSKPDIEARSSEKGGRIILIGDASHPMSPMGGSGGDTAIRNAADLALTIAQHGITDEIMQRFKERMETKAREKIEHSFRGGQKFWKGREWFEYTEADI
jgi:2-polyprenyl-6-methoxyphenol hydroxylase-like FAD-dependent oxidoreductase